MGEIFFKSGFWLIVALFVIGAVLDFALWIQDQETISLWLVANMRWFYWPAMVMLCFIGGMWLHLKMMAN